jgi:hypothetical protein
MMNKIREITIETHSITIVRTNGRLLSARCERCQKVVAVFTPNQTAMVLRLNLAEVYRRIEAGELHLIETGRGVAFVCGDLSGNAQPNNFLKLRGEK